MIGGTIARLLCICIGHIYPLYRTFKACHVPEGRDWMESEKIVEMKRILSYWCVWGVFTFAEYFVDFFVWWIPLYYEAKLLALLCLVCGNFSGAMFVFDNLIEEALSHHEFEIDTSLNKCKATMKQTGGRLMHSMYDGAATMAGVAMKKVFLPRPCEKKYLFVGMSKQL
jgi:receptor expression-enhancing protein 1/2/3/4